MTHHLATAGAAVALLLAAGATCAEPAPIDIVAAWVRGDPAGGAVLFLAAANPGPVARTIIGADAGAGPGPSVAITVPSHGTVFVEPGSGGVRVLPSRTPAPGTLLPVTLLLDGGAPLAVDAVVAAPGAEGAPELLAHGGALIALSDFGCDKLLAVAPDVQAAIGAWVLAYLHEPIDARAVRQVLADIAPGCEDHPDAVLLDIVDMLAEGEE